MRRNLTPWSKADLAMLRRMSEIGKSYADMAEALGRSRSAISGKCRKLGLQDPARNPVKRKWPGRRITRPVGQARGRAPLKADSMPAPAIKVTRGRAAENRMTPAPHPSTRAPRPSDSIWRPKTCQFPEGTPGEPDFRFCGAALEPADGRSYCPEHHRRCYLAPKKKEGDGPAAEFQMHGWGGRAA